MTEHWTSKVSLYEYERGSAEEAERRAAAHVGIRCVWGCGKTEFACSTCGGRVPIMETIDIFHVGICEQCGERTDESCRERTTRTGRMSAAEGGEHD
jgi:hypothetical protein